jgi:hypothetical protein
VERSQNITPWTINTTYSQVLERTGLLNVCEGGLELLQLDVDFCCCLLGFLDLHHIKRQGVKIHFTTSPTYRLSLEGLNNLDVCIGVVSHGLELLQELLSFIDDSSVLQDRTVVSNIDGSWLRRVLGVDTLSICVPLAEHLEGSNRICEPARW